ncbi:MAG: type II secretion system major pseudopilin GspG [Wenzhouxiangellaceae bacterium]|nr:type II secretion system major pseudopilin GspG [Wenzhouxiangellaceae bacterium]
MTSKSASQGFSLIELLVVLVILGLIATLVVPNIIGRSESAKHKIAETQVDRLSMAVETFYLDTGQVPNDLRDLVQEPSNVSNWNGEYVKSSSLNDPWGNPYEYRAPGQHGAFDIWSYGKDGAPGGEDSAADITSWE